MVLRSNIVHAALRRTVLGLMKIELITDIAEHSLLHTRPYWGHRVISENAVIQMKIQQMNANKIYSF